MSEKSTGLGDRPARRRDAARVQPDEFAETAPAGNARAGEPPESTGSSEGVLQPRSRKKTKALLNTRIEAETEQRLQAFRAAHDYAVTDVVEVALREFLDRHEAA